VVANEWTDVKGRGLFIEYPSVALGAGYSLIAGYPAVLYGHAPAQRPLEVHLAVTDVGRRGFVPVLLDGIKRERYWPRAVAAQGVAQVVWGQDTAKSEAQIPHVRELWHASYDGSRWSEPEKIWGPAEFTWDPGTASDLHSTQRGVALAVPAVVNRRSGLLYLERRHGRWIHVFIEYAGMPGQAELSPLGRDRTLVAFTAADVSAPGKNSNSLFATVVRSKDDEFDVGPIQRVHHSGLGASFSPRIHQLEGGEVALFWTQADSGTNRATHVLTATSTSGTRWESGTSAIFPDGLEGLHSVAEANTVFLASTREHGGPQVVYLEWSGGRWKPAIVLTNTAAETSPRVIRNSAGVFVVWSSAIATNSINGNSVPVTWRAAAPISCS
jgi:hypothetical protein